MKSSDQVGSDDDSETLEQELQKGLEGPAREMTKDDWEALRRSVWERHEAAQGYE